MDISTVKQHIQSKQFDNLYVFVGEEIEIMNIYINKMADVQQIEINRADTLMDIVKDLTNASLFSERKFYVVRNDLDLIKSEFDVEQFKESLTDSIVILAYNTLDKRSKFYKTIKSIIVEFNTLDEAILTKYIQKDIKLSDRYCKALISICENNYSRILNEMDKIKNFQKCVCPQPSVDEAFEHLLKDGTIYQPPEDAIFKVVEAILRKKYKIALTYYQDCVDINESNIAILSVLYNNAKQVLQVQSCVSNDIAKTTGLTAWQIKCAKDKANYYTDAQMIQLLKLIKNVDTQIKIGEIEEQIVIPYIIINARRLV